MLIADERLQNAKEKIKKKEGIGTLGEKTLHFVIKNYYEDDETKQEIKINQYYADIFNGQEIIEIQTRQFNRLREKLKTFLPLYPVYIIYPIINDKYVYWISPLTGEVTGGRKSPKKLILTEVFYELYKIKQDLNNPNLHLKLLVMDIEEYKYLDGWDKNKKRGATRFERIPLKIIDEICIDNIEDYKKLMPTLPMIFTSNDYAKAANVNIRYARIAINVLTYLGILEIVGKEKKKYIYKIKKS